MTIQKGESTVQTHIIEFAEFQHQAPAGPAILGNNLRVLDSVPITLTVQVGHIDTTVGELLSLQEAAVLRIDRGVDMPVDVVLNGNVVARGQLVAVDDNFGIRITDVAAKQP
jgi:flagellar motor switch protein FliN/FliY